jgi:SAM-dependent methyltransferase
MTVHDTTGEIRNAVREHYAAAARSATPCCGAAGSSERPASQPLDAFGQSQYDDTDRRLVPEEALVASLGCGNPTLLADLSPGDVVLDLGSGGGIDVLLSARRVSPGGKAYGLDLTPEMVELANANKVRAGADNVEFLLGSMEDIPLPDDSVDVIISHCVVYLSTDKERVFREAFRVLRPGGRLAISDLVLSRPLEPELTKVMGLWTGCIAGALTEDDCARAMRAAGFENVDIEDTTVFGHSELETLVDALDPGAVPAGLDLGAAIDQLDGVIRSAFIRATAPRNVTADQKWPAPALS